MLQIIGAPFDYCGREYGSRLGPAALRLANLVPTLQELGMECDDRGDLPVSAEHTEPEGIRNLRPFLETAGELRQKALQSLRSGRVPMILGGDHSMAIASISAALDHFMGEVAVLWIDAHADMNSATTSWSNNLHGMALGALIGRDPDQQGVKGTEWKKVLDLVGPTKLNRNNVAYFALRELDMAERLGVRESTTCYAKTMHDIDREGLIACLNGFDEWLRAKKVRNLWISYDVDALDPVYAPGTGTGVRGGLSYREGHLVAEMLRVFLDMPDCPYKLVGMDIVETNPLNDVSNQTAKISVEWVASLFGRTILGDK